jgi:hypothetical protein
MSKKLQIVIIAAGILFLVAAVITSNYELGTRERFFSTIAIWVGFALFLIGSGGAVKAHLDAQHALAANSANMPVEPQVKGNWRGLLWAGGILIAVSIICGKWLMANAGLAIIFYLPLIALLVIGGIIFVVRGVSIKIKSGE